MTPSRVQATGGLVRAAGGVGPLVRICRLHQWAKNLLLFLPILAAHRAGERQVLLRVTLAFVSFGLVASSVYVLNDVLDSDSDRRHPRKRNRPFASGAVGTRAALALVTVLLAAGCAIALLLPPPFAMALAGYWLVTLAYSAYLKRVPVVDIMILASLYTARLYAGAFAAGVPVSEWLASFSLFFFLSLAALKRAAELGDRGGSLPGRGYHGEDLALVAMMGIASGYVSVLVLALYVNHPEVTRLYSRPAWLWGLCVLVLYWLSRAWLLAWRGGMRDDPVVFAIRDRASWAVAILGAIVVRMGT